MPPVRKFRGRWWALAGLLILGLAYQVFCIRSLSSSPFYGNPILDARYQVEWAFELSRGADPHPVFFQAPLYSYLLAFLLRAAGWSVLLLTGLNLAFNLLTALAVYGTLRRLDLPSGVCAAGLVFVLFCPLHAYYAAFFHKTCLEIFLHALSLFLGIRLVHAARAPSTPIRNPQSAIRNDGPAAGSPLLAALAFGFSCGLFSLVRPTALVLGLLAAPFLGRRAGVLLPVVALGALPAVLWVLLHNHRGSGEWGVVSGNFGYTLFLGNNEENPEGTNLRAPAVSNNPLREEASSVELAERARGRRLSRREVDAFYAEQVVRFFRERPGAFLRTQVRKARWYLHPDEPPDNECYGCLTRGSLPFRASPFRWGLVSAFLLPALAGLFWGWRRGRLSAAEGFALAYAAALFLTLVVFYVSSRLRAGHLAPWLVVVLAGFRAFSEGLRAAAPSSRAGAVLLAIPLFLPGFFLAARPAPEPDPDVHTLKTAWLHADLGSFDRAEQEARRLIRLEIREELLARFAHLRALPADDPARLHLLSPAIPRRLPDR